MQRKLIPLLLAGLAAGSLAGAAPAPKKVWITLGDAAYAELQKLAPQALAAESRAMPASAGVGRSGGLERVHVVQVDEAVLDGLSESIHHQLNHCGGYMVHRTETEARSTLGRQTALLAAATATRPSYVIDNQATVNPLLPQMQESNIAGTINSLSSYTNRYYTSSHGVNASNWLAQQWQQMAGSRSDVTVEQFAHTGWAQKSVILTIKGTDNASEVVVIGGHLDSINGSGGSAETMRAPGADDDASGIASLTEAARIMLSTGYKPRRTIKFMGYAAEEVGLRGSQDIAKKFKADGVNVVGVMQLDMTNYKGSANDIYIYTDYTDSQQNTFLANLITTYLPTLKIGYDKCGYGCSDHASWNGQGYVASLPFEAAFNQDNPYIHSVNDTYANTGNQAAHALKFARLALAYAVELGSDGTGTPGGGDKVETFTGSVAKSQNVNYGPFATVAGSTFKAEITGTGDADLYVRKNAAPTTSTYDCRPYQSGSNETCSVNVTANGNAYVMVRGYTAAAYTLKVTYRPQ